MSTATMNALPAVNGETGPAPAVGHGLFQPLQSGILTQPVPTGLLSNPRIPSIVRSSTFVLLYWSPTRRDQFTLMLSRLKQGLF